MRTEFFPDYFEDKGNGHFVLKDKVFDGLEVFDFVITQNDHYRIVELENVKFINCKITRGVFTVYGNTFMKNVTIENMNCIEYHFTANNQLDNVQIIGGHKSILRMGRAMDQMANYIDGVQLQHPSDQNGICLDLSKFKGAMNIQHMFATNLKLNPELHIVAEFDRLKELPQDIIDLCGYYAEDFRIVAHDSETKVYISSLFDEDGSIDSEVVKTVNELRSRGLLA